MLVLTRRIGEEIVIGGNIHVNVVAIHGNRVRIAIRAPEVVTVDRLEIHERRKGFCMEPTGMPGVGVHS